MIKNVLLLLLVAGCVYQSMNPRVEVQVKEVRVAVAAPSRPSAPRLYYHSPLDAPAMPTGISTGTGYYSTDPVSRFTSRTVAGDSRPVSSGSGYVPARPAAPSEDSVNPLASVEALQTKLNEPTP